MGYLVPLRQSCQWFRDESNSQNIRVVPECDIRLKSGKRPTNSKAASRHYLIGVGLDIDPVPIVQSSRHRRLVDGKY